MTVFRRISVGEYIYESATDGIIAAGTTQATAAQLPLTEMNRLTTVAVGSGIMLPPAVPGLDIIVVNHGANAVQVYGQPGDTINDVVSATGVSQMQSSWVYYGCFSPGVWYSESLAQGFPGGLGGGFSTFATSVITASTTHTQAGATPITTMNVAVNTANASDAVLLPTAVPGLEVTIVNLSAANAMQVYATGSNTINGTAGATGVSQLASAVTIYFCFQAGAWVTK
jgi:hypothetical protein